MMARRFIDPSLRRLVGDHGNTAAAAARAPANKFGAKRSDCQHGHKHDSRAEARRCNDLHLMQRGGLISELRTQPQYWFVIAGRQVKHENGRRLGYRADFAYVDTTTGQTIVEDVKGGYRDDAWTLRTRRACSAHDRRGAPRGPRGSGVRRAKARRGAPDGPAQAGHGGLSGGERPADHERPKIERDQAGMVPAGISGRISPTGQEEGHPCRGSPGHHPRRRRGRCRPIPRDRRAAASGAQRGASAVMHHDYRSFLEAKAPLAQPAGLPCSIAYLREAEREAAVPTLFDLLAADGDAGEERQDAA